MATTMRAAGGALSGAAPSPSIIGNSVGAHVLPVSRALAPAPFRPAGTSCRAARPSGARHGMPQPGAPTPGGDGDGGSRLDAASSSCSSSSTPALAHAWRQGVQRRLGRGLGSRELSTTCRAAATATAEAAQGSAPAAEVGWTGGVWRGAGGGMPVAALCHMYTLALDVGQMMWHITGVLCAGDVAHGPAECPLFACLAPPPLPAPPPLLSQPTRRWLVPCPSMPHTRAPGGDRAREGDAA